MIKYIILMVASLWMAGCAAHDERYYSLHPDALQKAIAECPKNQRSDISCEQLKNIATRVNELAYQLRSNPQGYGKQILTLQETIARQESALRAPSHPPELQLSIVKNKQHLEEHLAIVKWLESPNGS